MKDCSSELNYKRLRARVAEAKFPLIPFPGVYLQDLTFLDNGVRTFLDERKTLLNFQKCQTTVRYIRELLVRPDEAGMCAAAPARVHTAAADRWSDCLPSGAATCAVLAELPRGQLRAGARARDPRVPQDDGGDHERRRALQHVAAV